MKTLSLVGLLLVVPGSLLGQDRAHQLASQAGKQKDAKCPATSLTVKTCHNQFPDGCSKAKNPNYDAYLSFLKDQDPDPKLASTGILAATDFQQHESKLPATTALGKTNHAKFATNFADLGEGNIYTVIAYLYFAEDTGNPPPPGRPNKEICNCELSGPNTADYHIGIGFNSTLADQARTTHPHDGDPLLAQLQKDSVVVEMTPYVRTHHPNWTISRVQALQGQQVKVVGQLMVDNDHFEAAADCAVSGDTTKCWRSTIWEIHPVTHFSVCQAPSGCSASSPDSDWKDLDAAKTTGGKKK